MSTTLFVYGTLLRGERNAVELAGARFVGEARTLPRYTLVDCGAWPTLVEAGTTSVRGELYAVPPGVLARLDAFEDHPRLFRRQAVALVGGLPAEAYLAPTNIAGPVIASGDWRGVARLRARAASGHP